MFLLLNNDLVRVSSITRSVQLHIGGSGAGVGGTRSFSVQFCLFSISSNYRQVWHSKYPMFVSNIVKVLMYKIALRINDCADDWTAEIAIITVRKLSLRKGNVFTCVCHSGNGGLCVWQVDPPWAGTPHPPLGRYTPW